MAFKPCSLALGRQAKEKEKNFTQERRFFSVLFCKILQAILLLRVASTEECVLIRKKFKYKHEMLFKKEWKVDRHSAASNPQREWGAYNTSLTS